jgi:hypothetical protein
VLYSLTSRDVSLVLRTPSAPAGSYVPGPNAWPCSYADDCLPVGLLSNKAAPGNGEQSISSLAFVRNIVLLNGTNATSPFQTLATQGLTNCSFDLNTYYSLTSGATGLQFPPSQAPTSFVQWQAGGHDGLSITADPLFVNPAAGDFSLLVSVAPFRGVCVAAMRVKCAPPRAPFLSFPVCLPA